MKSWLNNAVFYQIYPQSFFDINGDGIGDIQGIIAKLDYIKDLGCNAIWINPCFDSPFKDAGYDIKDYCKVAPRYGTNEDLIQCFMEAHKRGMRVILDLVPGHTSDEHEWFRESQKDEKNKFTNRYIWTTNFFETPTTTNLNSIRGNSERSAGYILNFFLNQPALNYGFNHIDADWQLPINHPDCLATRDAMKDVMRFWLDHGCDGFRIDMASSLVKNDDPERSGTIAVWEDICKAINLSYPEAVLISEWGNPVQALKAGFDCDFLLIHNCPGYRSLLRNYGSFFADNAIELDNSYFKKVSTTDISSFLNEYGRLYEATKDRGYISMITGNHDIMRIGYNLSVDELKLAYAFIFTMPGVPFLYYGDEIGMKHLTVHNKEGGYARTGSRTPMQWSNGKNLGFSDGNPDSLYLPVDPSENASTVEAQQRDPVSLYNTVKEVLALRQKYPELQATANFSFLYANERSFSYLRGSMTIAINPGIKEEIIPVDIQGKILWLIGTAAIQNNSIILGPQSFCLIS